MDSLHWEKRNALIWCVGLTTIALILLVVAVFTTWGGVGKNGVTLLLTVVVTAVIFLLTRALMNRYPQSLIRTLKLEYEPASFALRMLFKEKQIRFDKREEEESTRFEFPGQRVTLDLTYGLSGSLTREMGIQPHTVLTIHGVNAKHEPFVELLTQSIDEMAQSAKDAVEDAME